MKFIKGFRILLTNSWYNFSFILALISTGIISGWLLMFGSLTPSLTDPFQGLAISVVVSFQYYVMALVVLSLNEQGRTLFFEGNHSLRNQIGLNIVFIAIFMALGGASAAAGPVVGAALAFADASITAYFAILLGWNLSKSISSRFLNKKSLRLASFLLFLIVNVLVFGGVYMYLNLEALSFEQQIVLLMFPLGMVILPTLTIILRDKEKGPDLTSFMILVVFAFGIYYTLRLINLNNPQWTLADLIIQSVLLIYGLSTTTAKVHEEMDLQPMKAITVILLIILARVGSQVNRLLAAASGFGNIVQYGITSFTVLNLAVFALLLPAYWMWKSQTQSKDTQQDLSDERK
ncbi:DUF2975 domain-containing protein [Candidatus Thorarchaeota archaeon]|nr:MAG: DUF2975 domain-containing protein [Candidatus Thorarchaeota archaeon]